jgi:hypothetical protein
MGSVASIIENEARHLTGTYKMKIITYSLFVALLFTSAENPGNVALAK